LVRRRRSSDDRRAVVDRDRPIRVTASSDVAGNQRPEEMAASSFSWTWSMVKLAAFSSS
jgi:hypothetical protein